MIDRNWSSYECVFASFLHCYKEWPTLFYTTCRIWLLISNNGLLDVTVTLTCWRFKNEKKVSPKGRCYLKALPNIVGASNITYNLGLLSCIGICLIHSTIVNHKHCHFKFQNWSWDTSVIGGWSKVLFAFLFFSF